MDSSAIIKRMETALSAELHSDPVLSPEEVMGLEKQYLLQNYARYPLVLDRGKGCYLYDKAGNRYLDLISGIGVNALGYGHPRITKVIQKQAALLLHTSNLYYHEYQGRLAKRLCEASGLQRVFFANSGAEAMEGALKMVRSHGRKISPEKYEIIALEDSFHGRTFGALSITGQPKYRNDFEPLLPGVKFVPRNDEKALAAAFSEKTAGFVVEIWEDDPLHIAHGTPIASIAVDRDNTAWTLTTGPPAEMENTAAIESVETAPPGGWSGLFTTLRVDGGTAFLLKSSTPVSGTIAEDDHIVIAAGALVFTLTAA